MKRKTLFLPLLSFVLLLTTGCDAFLPKVRSNRRSSSSELDEDISEINSEKSGSERSSRYYYSSEEYYPESSESSSEAPINLAQTDDDSYVSYQLSSDGTYYIITGVTNNNFYAGKELYLPSIHNGLPVKEIGESAFQNVNIGGIYIAEGITTMGANAFGESTIQSAYIPSTLEELSFNAFAYSSLKKVVLSEGVKILHQQCFIGCPMTQVILPSTIIDIGTSCFQNCYYLRDVTLNEGLKTINTLGFCRCESLRYIYIPASVTSMGAAFFDCHNLNIEFSPDNYSYKIKNNCLMSFDETALLEYFDTNYLETYQVADNVRIIGMFCFAGSFIDTVVIKNTIDYIESGAFNGSRVRRIIFYGTDNEWSNVIRYSGPISDVEEVVIAGPLGQ